MARGSALALILVLQSLLPCQPATSDSADPADLYARLANPLRTTISATVEDHGVTTNSASVDLLVLAKPAATVVEAKQSSDGAASVECTVVTAGTDQLHTCFYAQSLEVPTGIRVAVDPTALAEPIRAGYYVGIEGSMTTIAGEYLIRATGVTILKRASRVPRPLSMALRSIGGADIGPEAGQKGVGAKSGPNNVGLLVRVWGRITQTGVGYLYIDDGSRLLEDAGCADELPVGMRVAYSGVRGYRRGQYVAVTGISSCYVTSYGNLAPQIITRSTGDVAPVMAQ